MKNERKSKLPVYSSPVCNRSNLLSVFRAVLVFWLLQAFGALATTNRVPFSITDFMVCERVNMEVPNDWHIPKDVFRTSDSNFFAWVELRNVTGTFPVTMKLYRPDGTFYGEETQTVRESNARVTSWWRMSARWAIKGDGVAAAPGRWRLDLLIDGRWQRSIFLALISAHPALSLLPRPKGGVSLTMEAQDTRICIVEASDDLVHWTAVHTNGTPGSRQWDMPVTVQMPACFYRMVLK